jgi:hypothetical protein
MKVQINTDKNIEGNERLEDYYTEELKKEFSHFDYKITRIEVHFSEETDKQFAADNKRCLLEFRLEKMDPLVVTAYSQTIEKAFDAAVIKATKVLITTFEKMRNY